MSKLKYYKLQGSDHFWKIRSGKGATRCGAKHMSKSKNLKTHRVLATFGRSDAEKVHGAAAQQFQVKIYQTHHALVEDGMPKICTLLRRETHSQSNP